MIFPMITGSIAGVLLGYNGYSLHDGIFWAVMIPVAISSALLNALARSAS